jgi:hypothetical protein
MTEHYVTDQIWFPCDKCGKQITHHSMHDCFVMNPDILPTLAEWRLICKFVKQQSELTDEEILDTARTMPVINGATMEQAYVLFARAILKKAESK